MSSGLRAILTGLLVGVIVSGSTLVISALSGADPYVVESFLLAFVVGILIGLLELDR